MPKTVVPDSLSSAQARMYWQGWFRRTVELAEESATVGVADAPLVWYPLPRKGAGQPTWLLKRRDEQIFDPYRQDHDLQLLINWQQVFRRAATPSVDLSLWRHCMEALVGARGYFGQRDAVLDHLLGRLQVALGKHSRAQVLRLGQPAGPRDPREMALLEEHVLRLTDNYSLMCQWGARMRAGFKRISPASLQPPVPGPRQVLDAVKASKAEYYAGARLPPPAPEEWPDPLRQEARWLMACDSWRDGARRAGDALVVNLPSYVLLSQLLERDTLLLRAAPYPAADAPREEYAKAGARWGEYLRLLSNKAWVTHRDPYELAAGLQWGVAADAPLVALHLTAIARTAEMARPAVRLRRTDAARPGIPVVLRDYQGTPVRVARRRIPRVGDRLYFQPPFAVSPDALEKLKKPATHQRVKLAFGPHWSVQALSWLAEATVREFGVETPLYPGALEFAAWAREEEGELSGQGFDAVLAEGKRRHRLEAWEDGIVEGLGSYAPSEDQVIVSYLDSRVRRPLALEEFELLSARLPGRSPESVRRRTRALMVQRARELGWAAFKQTGWWPGKNEARVVYQRSKSRA